MIFKTISSLFLIVAIVCILDLRPQQIADDVLKLTVKKQTIRDQARALRTGKKKKTIGQRLLYVQTSMAAMGRESKFAVVVCASLVLFVVGAVIGVLIKNVFLAPTFAAFLAAIPFVYFRNSQTHYEKHVSEELETTLSIITTSYARSGNLIKAVQENIGYIKPPLKEHFSAFLGDVSFIADTKQAIRNLKAKVDDDIYHEWCDALIQCQDDSHLNETLQPIVDKLKDVRIVNAELESMMASARMEYYTMVGLVVGNVPLLYILNKDWFHTLIFETPGKIVLGICGIVIFITYLFMLKFTKPVSYKG